MVVKRTALQKGLLSDLSGILPEIETAIDEKLEESFPELRLVHGPEDEIEVDLYYLLEDLEDVPEVYITWDLVHALQEELEGKYTAKDEDGKPSWVVHINGTIIAFRLPSD